MDSKQPKGVSMNGSGDIIKRRPPQPLMLVPARDGEYDDEADIREMSAKIQEFLYSISKGYSLTHSAALSGCKVDALNRWLDPKNANYKPKLYTLYKRAKAVFYAKQVDKVANSRDWRAAATWLERHEAEWNPKESRTISVDGPGGPMIQMDSGTIAELSAAYDKRMSKEQGKAGSGEARQGGPAGSVDKEKVNAKKEE